MDTFNYGVIRPGIIAHDFARDLALINHHNKLLPY